MKAIRNFSRFPAGLPLVTDDVLELHATRLLLLFKHCGKNARIDGLTKMAKLDFFVRYPGFFFAVCEKLNAGGIQVHEGSTESSMVRYHYGPWDQRYYHALAYLKARGLIGISQKKYYSIKLSDKGNEVAKELASSNAFDALIDSMKTVKKVLGDFTGTKLKNLIYETFDKEIAAKSIGEAI